MPTLKRVLKLRTLAATSAGLGLASSVYAAVVQAADTVGERLLWAAVALAALVCILTARNFAELAGKFPNAGGVQVYIRNAFGEKPSNTVTLMYIMLAVAAGAAESYIFASVLQILFATFNLAFLASLPLALWVFIVLTIFMGINLVGVAVAGRTQEFLTLTMLFLLVGISLFALLQPAARAAPPPAAVDPLMFTQAVAYAIYLFIGFEWITPLAEETEDVKSLGKAMTVAIIALAACYSIFGTAVVKHIDTSAIINSTTPHMEFAGLLAGRAGIIIMGAISVIATFTAFNAGIMGTSRLLYAMAREGVLPKFLAKIHLRFFTPWSALCFIFTLQLLFALFIIHTGSFKTPIFVAAAVECIIYTIVSLAVLKLRRWKNILVPGITALIFGSLTVLMMFPPTPPAVVIFLTAGLALAMVYSVLIAPRLSAGD